MLNVAIKVGLISWYLLILAVFCRATPNQDRVYRDEIFDKKVKTVRLFTADGPLFTSAFPVEQSEPVVLRFDVLELDQNATYGDYNVKVIHCNADWHQSALYDMDFLGRFNEFQVNNEQLSFNTKIPFGQYQWPLPRVKRPGNYVLQVYQGSDENKVLFTHRFMVYGRLAGVSADVVPSEDISRRNSSQQVEIFVDYSGLNVPNPREDFHVVIRQNRQWFNMIDGLKPTFVRAGEQRLEYRPFDLTNNFYAASEFRFFDLRTVNALGQNVGKILREKVPTEALLLPDQSRSGQAYSQIDDLNGRYIIGNLEIQGDELAADYLLTHFFLKTDHPADGNVYVIGEFGGSTLNETNRMTYDEALGGYRLNVLLKQGFYNYLYYVDGPSNPYAYDGNHFQTENQYEVFVYTRPIGERADLLVGYTTIIVNAQNRSR